MDTIVKDEFTPDQLLKELRILNISGKVKVLGTVTRITPYPSPPKTPRIVYGTIQDPATKSSIEFLCPPESAPLAIGEHVIIFGTLRAEPNKLASGLKIEISERVDSWASLGNLVTFN